MVGSITRTAPKTRYSDTIWGRVFWVGHQFGISFLDNTRVRGETSGMNIFLFCGLVVLLIVMDEIRSRHIDALFVSIEQLHKEQMGALAALRAQLPEKTLSKDDVYRMVELALERSAKTSDE